MKKPEIPLNEKERLESLNSYGILDTESDCFFDTFTLLSKNICEVPICVISFVDSNRQWFKSKQGVDVCETSRDISFCGHAINQTEIFIIEDATKDERFFDNPLVTGELAIRFYAGKPLINEDGYALGTICVIDQKPRSLSRFQLDQLNIIGDMLTNYLKKNSMLNSRINSLNLLDQLAKNLPGCVYTFQMNPDGHSSFPYSSKQLQDIYEVGCSEVQKDASVVSERIHPEDLSLVASSVNDSATRMTKWTCDYRVNLPSKGLRWLRGNANPEKSADGSILWHGYIEDITEAKTQEEINLKSSKMATLGMMSAGIAHEINNPLAIIKLASQQLNSLVARNDLESEKLEKIATKIDKTTNRISKIIKGLSFFTGKVSHNEFEIVDLNLIVEDTIALCSEKFFINNIKFQTLFPEEYNQLKVECKAVEISQIILNLLNNSIDAIENQDEKWITLNIENRVNYLRISVMDSGHGISSEEAMKILEPFYTTKSCGKGTGLGLSISQKIIEMHKGKIWIDTKSPHTKIIFEIPFHQYDLIKSAS
jgi:signal transduction histidine kinase